MHSRPKLSLWRGRILPCLCLSDTRARNVLVATTTTTPLPSRFKTIHWAVPTPGINPSQIVVRGQGAPRRCEQGQVRHYDAIQRRSPAPTFYKGPFSLLETRHASRRGNIDKCPATRQWAGGDSRRIQGDLIQIPRRRFFSIWGPGGFQLNRGRAAGRRVRSPPPCSVQASQQ